MLNAHEFNGSEQRLIFCPLSLSLSSFSLFSEWAFGSLFQCLSLYLFNFSLHNISDKRQTLSITRFSFHRLHLSFVFLPNSHRFFTATSCTLRCFCGDRNFVSDYCRYSLSYLFLYVDSIMVFFLVFLF